MEPPEVIEVPEAGAVILPARLTTFGAAVTAENPARAATMDKRKCIVWEKVKRRYHGKGKICPSYLYLALF
jgi:hypothetical protein